MLLGEYVYLLKASTNIWIIFIPKNFRSAQIHHWLYPCLKWTAKFSRVEFHRKTQPKSQRLHLSTYLKPLNTGNRTSSVLVLFLRGVFVAFGNHSGPDCSPCCAKKLGVGKISRASVLVQKNVQRLLVYSGIGKFHFRLRLLCGVNNRGAANLGQFLAVSVKSPTADFVVADQVFNEKDPPVEAKR